MNVWSHCLQRLEQEYPAEDVHTWLKPLQAINHNNELHLLAPNAFVVERIQADYLSRIQALADHFAGSPLPADEIYARDIEMIQAADIVVAEVTNPSLGVGYELAYAEKLQKPILCLFNPESGRKLSAMVSGNSYNTVLEYSAASIPAEKIKKLLNS